MVTLTGGAGGTPSGTILAFAGAIADIPLGFLHCDGSTISRNDFGDLFLAIGTAWGDGGLPELNFEIPDLQGRFMRGKNNGSGNDPDVLTRTEPNDGGNAGDNVGSYQADKVGPHYHKGPRQDWPHQSAYAWGYDQQFVGVGIFGYWKQYTNMITSTANQQYRYLANTSSTIKTTGTTPTSITYQQDNYPKNVNVVYIIKF